MSANQTKSARTETATAKILFFDVETSPNIGYTWGVWEQNVIKVIRPRQIICFSWKWLGEKKSHVLAMPDFPGYRKDRENNKLLIMALHRLISQADIVVGHNIDGFDDKRSNTDFIRHGLNPPPPHKTVDTLKVARSKFQFNSNKLNDLGLFLNVGQKVKHCGFELWERCLSGDMKAWGLMKRYNRGDVDLLERVYLKERPWMTNHPAIKPRDNGNRNPPCPMCHERRLISRGFQINRKGRIPRVQCQGCGCWPTIEWRQKEWRLK